MALVAGDCRASIVECDAAGAALDEISAGRAVSSTGFPEISVSAGIAGLCDLIAGAALVDVEAAGHAISEIVDYRVGDAELADCEGSDWDGIAAYTIFDVVTASSADVGSTEEESFLADTASSCGSVVAAGQAVSHIITAESACLRVFKIGCQVACGAIDLRSYRTGDAIGDPAG